LSCCKTSLVPVVVLSYCEGASVAFEIATEVEVVPLAKVLMADGINIFDVIHLRDVNVAIVYKFLKFILIVFAPRLYGGGIGHCRV
jgi:hypothetical protein